MAKNKKSFKSAVDNTAGISGHHKAGLQALGSYSSRIKATDTSLLEGSVDIDGCLKASHPDDARWDYAIGYDGEAYFVEVHPANTSNVEEMIKKANWLKAWLKSSAPYLLSLHRCGVFHWIPSGNVRILPNSPQSRKIAKSNLKITGTIMVLK